MVVRVDGRRPPMKGDTIHVRPQVGHVHLFDATSGARWATRAIAASHARRVALAGRPIRRQQPAAPARDR